MRSFHSGDEVVMLDEIDFIVLHQAFVDEILSVLPVPATVSFASGSRKSAFLPSMSQRSMEAWDQAENHKSPLLLGTDTLVFSVSVSGSRIYVLVTEVDPALLAKMSLSWLEQQQEEIGRRLLRLKQLYIEPEGRMYSWRAALQLGKVPIQDDGVFCFVSVDFGSRAIAADEARSQRVSDLLCTITPGVVFWYNCRIFGLYLPGVSAEKTLMFIRQLQRHLKREGCKRAQFGFSSCGENMLTESWRGLLAAEKRGPFGICDIHSLALDPFALPPEEIVQQFKRKWRGKSHFCVGAVLWTEAARPVEERNQVISSCILAEECHIDNDRQYTYLFFHRENYDELVPVFGGNKEAQKRGIQAVGLARWPCPGLTMNKSQTIVNSLKALKHCLFLEPGSVVFFDGTTLNISGDYYFDQGDYYTAARDYRSGLRLCPDNINLLNSLGVTQVELRQYSRAEKSFRAVLSQQPDNYMALVNLGFLQQASGRNKQAILTFENARKTAPRKSSTGGEVLLPLSRLYMAGEEYEQAVSVLEEWMALPESSNEHLLYRLLGRCYYEIGRKKEAVFICQKALQLHAQDSECLSLLGILYLELGQGEDIGETLCRQAFSLNPVNPDILCRYALTLYLKKQYEQALDYVTATLRQDNSHLQALLLYANILAASGQYRQAVRILEKNARKKTLTDRRRQAIMRHLQKITKKGSGLSGSYMASFEPAL